MFWFMLGAFLATIVGGAWVAGSILAGMKVFPEPEPSLEFRLCGAYATNRTSGKGMTVTRKPGRVQAVISLPR